MYKTSDFLADEDLHKARVALLLKHFSRLDDDREPWRIVYPLSEVLLLLLEKLLGRQPVAVRWRPRRSRGARRVHCVSRAFAQGRMGRLCHPQIPIDRASGACASS